MQMDLASYGMDMSQTHMVILVLRIGWAFKFIFAIGSDMVFYKMPDRRYIIAFASFCTAIPALCLSIRPTSASSYLLLSFFFNTVLAVSDVNYDAMMIREIKNEPTSSAGYMLFYTTLGRRLGGFLGDVLGPIAWENIGSSNVYIVLGGTCSLSLLTTIFYPEQPMIPLPRHLEFNEHGTHHHSSFIHALLEIFKILSRYPIRGLLLYILYTELMPSFDLVLLYYEVGPLGFTPKQMSLMYTISGIVSVLSTFIYYKASTKNILFVCMIVSTLSIIVAMLPLQIVSVVKPDRMKELLGDDFFTRLNISETPPENVTIYTFSTAMGIDNYIIAVLYDAASTTLRTVQDAPLISLISEFSVQALEGSTISCALSLMNMAGVIQLLITSGFVKFYGLDYGNYTNIAFFVVTCIFFKISAALLSMFTPDTTIHQAKILHELTNTRERTTNIQGFR